MKLGDGLGEGWSTMSFLSDDEWGVLWMVVVSEYLHGLYGCRWVWREIWVVWKKKLNGVGEE